MVSRILNFLFHPDAFFSELAAGPHEYKLPLVIVGICMVLDAVRQFLLMDWMRQFLIPVFASMTGIPQVNELFAGALNLLLLVSVAENIPAFIAYWLIIAAVVFIISSYFSAEGTIYKTIIATGWGMAPLIVYNAVAIPLFLMYRNTMSITISPELLNQSMSRRSHRSSFSHEEDYSKYIQVNQPFIEHSQIQFALFAVALLCCSIYWMYAIKNIRKISLFQAAVSSVLPVALFLGILLGAKLMYGWVH